MLIPRSPSPTRPATPIPLEERPIKTLSQAEKDELVRRQQVSIQSPCLKDVVLTIVQARYRAERAGNVKREAHGTPGLTPKSERGVKRERDEEMEEMIASFSARKVKTHPFTRGEIVELDWWPGKEGEEEGFIIWKHRVSDNDGDSYFPPVRWPLGVICEVELTCFCLVLIWSGDYISSLMPDNLGLEAFLILNMQSNSSI